MRSLLTLSALLALPLSAFGQSFGPVQLIDGVSPYLESIECADIDGDGDLDILFASYADDVIGWYENDGSGLFGARIVINFSATGAVSAVSADVDSDGDLDVISSSFLGHKIGWHENLGGGNFGSPLFNFKPIDLSAKGTISLEVGDLDGDGDLDLVAAEVADTEIRWYENLGGTFGPRQVVQSNSHGARGLHLVDIDGDLDLDVLYTEESSWDVQYNKNDGSGNFGSGLYIDNSLYGAYDVSAGDFDGDGDIDVVACGIFGDELSWYENNGGFPLVNPLLISDLLDGPTRLCAVDFEGDGDLDLAVVTLFGQELNVFLNQGGVFSPALLVGATGAKPRALGHGDLDGDGDPDLLVSTEDGKLVWYRNLMGDCNGNGLPDVDDIASGLSLDCDGNGVPDECEPDCNGNGITDACDISTGFDPDCNGNEVPDSCDIASGLSLDFDSNGIPDECVPPALAGDIAAFSVSAGGIQVLTLNGTVAQASQLYFMLGTASGTTPGIPVDAVTLPLVADKYLMHTLLNPSTPPLTGSFGVLAPTPGGTGSGATATFSLPAASNPALVGLTVHHAYLVLDLLAGGHVTFVSNPAPLHFLP